MSAIAARTRWLAVPIVALSVVGLAACSSGDSTTGTSASSSATASGSAAPDEGVEPAGMAQFKQCMSEHGVTMPARRGGGPSGAAGRPGGHAGGPGGEHRDPTKAPPGVDQNTWTTARAACASLAPIPPAAPGN